MRTPTETLNLGVAELKAKVEFKPVAEWLQAKARAAPGKAEVAMKRAVAWWHAQALPRVPVRASRNRQQKRAGLRGPLYSRVGRGQLKKRTQPYVNRTAEAITGGILSGTYYAIWLAAGTRRIAGGRVLAWRPGQPTIKDWPAKREGGNPRGELPIIIPWQHRAREQLIGELKKAL